MSETTFQVLGPLSDPAQAEAARDFAVKGVVAFALFLGLLYWWANR